MYDAITKVIPVARAAVAIEPTPILKAAYAIIPLHVNPVSKLYEANKGSALALLALLALLFVFVKAFFSATA